MSIRIVYPTVTKHGLGNNIITVAKAYLIAKSCKMRYLPPIWPPCIQMKQAAANGYGYYFPSTLADKLKVKLIEYQYRLQRKTSVQVWPTLCFDRKDYEHTGVVDAGEACLAYLRSRSLDDPSRSAVITTAGMWGAYAGIRRARAWLSNLLMSHPDTRKLLMEVEQLTAGRLRIAVNIRMGDFAERGGVTVDGVPTITGRITEGERNVRLPLDWYTRICSLIREACNCEFILVSDGARQELQPFLDEIRPVNILGAPFQDLVGALLMSRAGLTICSNSTYSRFSVFLSDKPYIWCANTLIKDPSGRYGYLWSDGGNFVPASDSSDLDTIRRCFALGISVSALPKGLKRYLDSNGELGIEAPADLLYRDPVRIL